MHSETIGKKAQAADSFEDKKAFLSRYGCNELEIERLEQEIELWESRAERMTASFSEAFGKSSGGDRVQNAVGELVELRAALYDRLTDSTTLRLDIEGCLAQVDDDRLRLLLELRYIDGLTWENVAQRMHTEYRWVLRLHKKALEKIKLSERR